MKHVLSIFILSIFSLQTFAASPQQSICHDFFSKLSEFSKHELEFISEKTAQDARTILKLVDAIQPLYTPLKSQRFMWQSGVRFEPLLTTLTLIHLNPDEIFKISSRVEVVERASAPIKDEDMVKQRIHLSRVDFFLLNAATTKNYVAFRSGIAQYIEANMSDELADRAARALVDLESDLSKIKALLMEFVEIMYSFVFTEPRPSSMSYLKALEEINLKLQANGQEDDIFVPNASTYDSDTLQLSLVRIRESINRILLN